MPAHASLHTDRNWVFYTLCTSFGQYHFVGHLGRLCMQPALHDPLAVGNIIVRAPRMHTCVPARMLTLCTYFSEQYSLSGVQDTFDPPGHTSNHDHFLIEHQSEVSKVFSQCRWHLVIILRPKLSWQPQAYLLVWGCTTYNHMLNKTLSTVSIRFISNWAAKFFEPKKP